MPREQNKLAHRNGRCVSDVMGGDAQRLPRDVVLATGMGRENPRAPRATTTPEPRQSASFSSSFVSARRCFERIRKTKQRNRIKIRLAVRRGTYFKPQPSGRSLRDYAAEKKRYHHRDVLKVASFISQGCIFQPVLAWH